MCVQQKLEEGQLLWAYFVGLWDCIIEKNGHEPLNTVPSFPEFNVTETYFLPVLEPEVQTQIQTRLCSLHGFQEAGGVPLLPLSASDGFWLPWLWLQPSHLCLQLHIVFSAHLFPFSLVRMLVIDLRPTLIQNDLIPRSLTQLNLKRLCFPIRSHP